MIVRTKAPLRLGLAGGGTDVSPYCDMFGGCVLNATINMFAHVTLELCPKKPRSVFTALDLGISDTVISNAKIPIEGPLKLHRAVHRRIMNEYVQEKNISVSVISYSDAPPGSGLGSSSTMVVALIAAYKEMFSLPLGEYDVARLAYDIERLDCGLSGGRQDQYAATFGGFNLMEFEEGERVIVNPLRVGRHIVNELEASMVLYYTGTSRESEKIIEDQKNTTQSGNVLALNAMHELKASASRTKEKLLKSDVEGVAQELKKAWSAKKSTSKSISNSDIQELENDIMKAGAISLKISGAGGGGYMMIFTKPENKFHIVKKLLNYPGKVNNFQFTEHGSMAWKIQNI